MAFYIFFSAIFLLVPAIHSHNCAPVDFTISTLTSAPFWWFEVDPSYCLSDNRSAKSLQGYMHNVNESNCMIIFSICKELPILCPGQGVCKIQEMDSSFKYISWPVDLGSMENDGQASFSTGDNFFRIDYRNGKQQSCKTAKGEQQSLQTVITFNCEKNTKWNATVKKEAPFAGGAKAQHGTIIFDKKECAYRISFNSSEGCPDYGPGGTKGHPLSTGSILLILFFPSVFLYCVIGGMINAGRNKSGTQLIPNYDFWKDLPYLILDGFGFVVSIITCSKIATTSAQPTRSYQSM